MGLRGFVRAGYKKKEEEEERKKTVTIATPHQTQKKKSLLLPFWAGKRLNNHCERKDKLLRFHSSNEPLLVFVLRGRDKCELGIVSCFLDC